MFKYDMDKMVPRFILADKNGYAVAKALATGMQMLNDIIERSLRMMDDVAYMPEWRLDEVAWEKNCLYDLGAGVEQKRIWIANADEDIKTYGTEYGIKQFLKPYFDNVTVLQYEDLPGIAPFHFRVYIGNENVTQERLNWALRSVNTVKNVRSICDGINLTGEVKVTGLALYGSLQSKVGLLGNFILGEDLLA